MRSINRTTPTISNAIINWNTAVIVTNMGQIAENFHGFAGCQVAYADGLIGDTFCDASLVGSLALV